MDLTFTPEQDAWREEVRAFLDAELPPDKAFNTEFEEDDELWDFAIEFTRRLGKKGWIGLTWPEKYGGLGRPVVDRLILSEELERREAPVVNTIGWGLAAGALLAGGSDEQCRSWLPPIASMEVHVAEGLSEPGAGSDLAALSTVAKRDGDDWIVSGQKTYTTWGTRAEWLFTAARSDSDSSRHRGITMFMVPMNVEGVTLSPLWNLAGGRQNHTYLDDVRIPDEYRIGDIGQGWHLIMNAFYGGGIGAQHIYFERTLEELVDYCRKTVRGGAPMIEDPVVRQQLGELAILAEEQRVLAYEGLSNHNHQRPPRFAGALGVVVSKETRPVFSEICQEIMGPLSQLRPGRWAPLHGQIEALYRQSYANHAGGTSQVKRMVLATRGLGLPR